MTKTILGKKLQHLRKEKKWTQDKLGELIGIHGRSIGKYEAGMSNPSRETLQKLANIFEVSMEYFLVEDENTLASVPIRDKELLQYFLKVDRMDDEVKKVIKSVIDGMIAKEKSKKP
jgi:transcriptional regulator with XRE-family HTH domain